MTSGCPGSDHEEEGGRELRQQEGLGLLFVWGEREPGQEGELTGYLLLGLANHRNVLGGEGGADWLTRHSWLGLANHRNGMEWNGKLQYGVFPIFLLCKFIRVVDCWLGWVGRMTDRNDLLI